MSKSTQNDAESASSKESLVVCYSPVENDARVSHQIEWLEAAGYRVSIMSRGPEHPSATGRRFKIGELRERLKLIFFAFMPARIRFHFTVEKYIPAAELEEQNFDLVIVNDHHLLPWITRNASKFAKGTVALDLHELYSNNGTDLIYKLLIAPYDDWLLTFISNPVFTHRMTVADGIADIYRDEFGIPRPSVVRNVAHFENLRPSKVDPDNIELVHHGYAAVERGIDLMLDAVLLLEPRFKLKLMVLGDEKTLENIKKHPAFEAGRAELREPVKVTEVARALNGYDLEMIFFPPRFPNNKHALPNKFFESVQGRLGVIIGDSPEIIPLVESYGLGIVVDGWTAQDLASAINSLTTAQIEQLKSASDSAAEELSTRGEGKRFFEAIGIKDET